MGAGQSKTETVYSRYSKDTEILDSLKITPAVLERVQAAENSPGTEQLAHQQEIIQQQQQLSQQMHYQHEKELTMKEQEYREKLENQQNENELKFRELQESLSIQNASDESTAEKLQLLEATLREEYEAKLSNTSAAYEEQLGSARAENDAVKTDFEAQLSEVSAVDKKVFEETVEQTKRRATEEIRSQTEKLAAEQQKFLEKQQREKDEIMRKTKKFFSPNETKNICGDITNAVATCYSENPKNTMLCAEVVRQLQACVTPEKQNYLLKQHVHAESA